MAERVTFASNGGSCGGLFAVPASGRGPGVVVIQEWWGLVPHVENLVDRFAEAGFVALAPDLYHGVKTDEPDEAMRMMMALAMDPAAETSPGPRGSSSRAIRPTATGSVPSGSAWAARWPCGRRRWRRS